MNDTMRDIYARWPWLYRQPIGVTRGGIAVFACACVAIFAGFFAVGHATVPAKTPQLQASAGLALTYSGAAIPASLSAVPSISTIDFATVPVKVARRTTPATTTVASHTTAAVTPSRTVTPSPPVSAPSTTVPASSHTQHRSSGGVSFNSSG
jgi:hypothetical protein